MLSWLQRHRALIAILAGFVTTGTVLLTGGSGAAKVVETAQRGPIAIQYEAPWRLERAAGESGDLRLARPLTLRRSGAVLVAGGLVDPAPVPGGEPPAFARAIKGQAVRQTDRLGRTQAVRYSGEIRGGRARVALYVIPTNRGDIGLFCRSLSGYDGPCRSGLLDVRLYGRHSEAPGADQSLERGLEEALQPVSTAEVSAASPQSSAGVARLAHHLCRVARNAAADLADLSPQPRDRSLLAALRQALEGEAQALGRAARHAREGERDEYGGAVAVIQARSSDVTSAVSALGRSGFKGVSRLGGLNLPPLPQIQTVSTAPPEPEVPGEPSSGGGSQGSGEGGGSSGGGSGVEHAQGIETPSPK